MIDLTSIALIIGALVMAVGGLALCLFIVLWLFDVIRLHVKGLQVLTKAMHRVAMEMREKND